MGGEMDPGRPTKEARRSPIALYPLMIGTVSSGVSPRVERGWDSPTKSIHPFDAGSTRGSSPSSRHRSSVYSSDEKYIDTLTLDFQIASSIKDSESSISSSPRSIKRRISRLAELSAQNLQRRSRQPLSEYFDSVAGGSALKITRSSPKKWSSLIFPKSNRASQYDTWSVDHYAAHDSIQDSSITLNSAEPPVASSPLIPVLPPVIVQHLFTFFNPQDLLKLSVLSKAWEQECSQPHYWHRFCQEDGINLSPSELNVDELASKCPGNSSKLWMEAWKQVTRQRINIKYGKYRLTDVCVADIRDAVTSICLNTDRIMIGTRRHKLLMFTTDKLQPSPPETQMAHTPIHRPQPDIQFHPEHLCPITTVSFSSTSSSISNIGATGDRSGNIMVWNTFTGSQIAGLDNVHAGGVTSVLVLAPPVNYMTSELRPKNSKYTSPPQAILVSSGFDKVVRVHELRIGVSVPKEQPGKSKTRKHLGQGKLSKTSLSAPKAIQWSMSKLRIYGKGRSNDLQHSKASDVHSLLETVMQLRGHSGDVYCLCVAENGRNIMSGSLDCSVKVWDITMGDWVHSLAGHTDIITCVATAGDKVYSASLDRAIRVWSYATGAALNVLSGSNSWIKVLGVVEDRVVSAGWDEAINVWDAKTGRLRHSFAIERGPIVALQVDKSRIVVASRGELTHNQITVLDFGIPLKLSELPRTDLEDDINQKLSEEKALPQTPHTEVLTAKDTFSNQQEHQESNEIHQAEKLICTSAETLNPFSTYLGVLHQQPSTMSDETDLTEYLACTEGQSTDDDMTSSDDEELDDIWEDA